MAREFGKYELIDRIGAGGMAEVSLAKSFGAEGLEKILVIKRILPEYSENPRFVDMFISEAKIAVDLNHPNIVQIYDFGRVEETYYLAMEYVDGCDLGQLISASRRADAPLSVGDAVFVAIEIARGLHYAHNKLDRFGEPLSIVHRDISPQNILISRDGTVKIVDFGIAKATSVAEERPEVVKGKFSYMSPEQASGEPVDHRSDIFSLGIVLFEMLCRRPLFRHTTQEQTLSLVKSAVVPDIASLNAEVPGELEALLYRVLSRDPDERPADARALQVELTRVLYGLGDIFDAMTLSSHLGRLEPWTSGEGGAGSQEGTRPAQTTASSMARTSAMATITGGTSLQTETPVTRLAGDTAVEPNGPAEIHSRERKEVVIVAGELDGLFELRSAMGQDRWLQVLQEYTRIVDSVAYKNGAVVQRINEDGFVLLFGLPVSSENDAEHAVRVTMDLHEAVLGMNPSLDSPIHLSSGIAVGDVVLEQEVDETGRRYSWSFLGAAHELADRLARSAMPREVLLGGQVYRRIKRDYRCEKVDRVRFPEQQGEGVDIQAYGLVGPKSPQEQISELRRSYHRFYGREIELKRIREAYRSSLLEQRACAYALLGRPGIGKSTVVEEFLRGLDPRNVRVVRGVVPVYQRDVPLGPMADLLADVLRLGDRDDLRQVRDTLRTRVSALFPEADEVERDLLFQSLGSIFNIRIPGGDFEGLDREDRRDRIFLSLQRLLIRFAEKKPMVLAIDDAHNIDPMTLQFMRMMFDSTHKAPAFVLLTADSDGSHVEAQAWRGLLEAKHIALDRLGELTRSEARQLVHDLLRLHRIEDASLEDEIVRRSGGNPLFLKEVVEVLRDRGMLRDNAERRGLDGELATTGWLPANVEGLIAARIDRLTLPLKAALQRAAFLWSPFGGEDMALVLGDEGAADEVEGRLEALVDQGLLERADEAPTAVVTTWDPSQTPADQRRYRFCNALTREVAARGLLPEHARQLHRVLAEHLLDQGDADQLAASALIAHHFEGAGDAERSVDFYFKAADQALDQFGASESLRLCQKVLDRGEEAGPYRFRALKIKAQALSELGHREQTAQTLDEIERLAEAMDDHREQIDVLLQKARFFFEGSMLREAKEAVERALALAEANDDRLRVVQAWLTQAAIRLNEGSREAALELAHEAAASFGITEPGQQVDVELDPAAASALVRSLNLIGVVHRQAGRHSCAWGAYEQALEIAHRHELRRWKRRLWMNSALALAFLGRFGESLRYYDQALEEVRRLGHRREESNLLINIGHAHLLRGELDEAFAAIRRGNYLARKTNATHHLADGLITLGACYLEQGEHEKAEHTLHEGLRLADSIPIVYLSVRATLLLAQVHLARGSQEAIRIALMQAEDALERSEAAQMRWGVGYGHMLMGRALKMLGSREEAIYHSKKAIEVVDAGEVFAIEEILYHHTQILPDEPEYELDRKQAIMRAREVVSHRRDSIAEEEVRQIYVNTTINRQIMQTAKLLLD